MGVERREREEGRTDQAKGSEIEHVGKRGRLKKKKIKEREVWEGE